MTILTTSASSSSQSVIIHEEGCDGQGSCECGIRGGCGGCGSGSGGKTVTKRSIQSPSAQIIQSASIHREDCGGCGDCGCSGGGEKKEEAPVVIKGPLAAAAGEQAAQVNADSAECEEVEKIVNLDDLYNKAMKKLDPVDYDYYANGSEAETTLKRNYSSWSKYRVWPRFLSGEMGNVDASRKLKLSNVNNTSGETETVEIDLTYPTMVTPMAMQKLAHPDGEVALAKACKTAGVLYCITQQATTKIETICQESLGGPKMFQMYMFKNRALSKKLIDRCEKFEDVKAIVITIDSPVLGRREKDLKNKFTPASRGVEIANWNSGGKLSMLISTSLCNHVESICFNRCGSRIRFDRSFQKIKPYR